MAHDANIRVAIIAREPRGVWAAKLFRRRWRARALEGGVQLGRGSARARAGARRIFFFTGQRRRGGMAGQGKTGVTCYRSSSMRGGQEWFRKSMFIDLPHRTRPGTLNNRFLSPAQQQGMMIDRSALRGLMVCDGWAGFARRNRRYCDYAFAANFLRWRINVM